MVDVGGQLGPRLGLLAGTFTHGPFLWPRLLPSRAASGWVDFLRGDLAMSQQTRQKLHGLLRSKFRSPRGHFYGYSISRSPQSQEGGMWIPLLSGINKYPWDKFPPPCNSYCSHCFLFVPFHYSFLITVQVILIKYKFFSCLKAISGFPELSE